jgi:ABC-type sugar transport system ATPase subunit
MKSVSEDNQRTTILEIRDLHKSFPGVEALKGVNFVLKEGDIHGLLGQNGAGKSTLIKILTGVYSMTRGHIFLNNEEIRIRNTQEARSFGLSTIYQDTNLIEPMSVAENLMLGSFPTHGPFRFVDRKRMCEMVIPFLEKVNLDIDPLILVENLTQGQKQIVMLAKILIQRKKIIILDEPTTALNNAEVNVFFNVLRDLKSQGLGIIYISHVLDEVFEICDLVTIIRDGLNVVTKRTRDLNKVEVSQLMVGHKIKERFDIETEIGAQPVIECFGFVNGKLTEPINVDVKEKEIVGIVGAKGSGKEELVRLILGLGNQTNCRVLLKSKDITRWDLPKRINNGIGFIPPERLKEGIFPNMPCMYNITIPSLSRYIRIGGLINKRGILKVANEFIRIFGIKAINALQETKRLSGGNQQKVVISRWFNVKAKLYLMCDPTTGVDVGAKDEIYELIIKIAKEGSGILLVSNDLDEIFKICHRIIVLHRGCIVFESIIANTDKREVVQYLMGGKSQ